MTRPAVFDAVAKSGSVGFGVIGARSMVAERAVLPALDASKHAHLVAAASLSGDVPAPWTSTSVDDYDAVLDHPDVEAVYIPLPNGLHQQWVIRAAAAGKHVLCEKPLAPTADAARAMSAACDSTGVLLAEAWMTPFDPRWSHTLDLVGDSLIHKVREINATFTSTINPEAIHNYRWDPNQGGGALLDVGIYCLGAAVQLWGPDPIAADATISLSRSGVDASTTARLTWPDGQIARIRCSFVDSEQQRLELVGEHGSLILDGDAHTGGLNARTIRHIDADGRERSIIVEPRDPYELMLDAFARSVRGVARWPRPVERSIEMLDLLNRVQRSAT